MLNLTTSPRVTEILGTVKSFSVGERLVLAKLLLDSLWVDEYADDVEWGQMSLVAFEQEWDNPDDAIYDDWRAHYGVPAR